MNIPPSSLARFVAAASTDDTADKAIIPPDTSTGLSSPIDPATVDASMALNAATIRKSDNITPSPQRVVGPLKTPEDWEQSDPDLIMTDTVTNTAAAKYDPTSDDPNGGIDTTSSRTQGAAKKGRSLYSTSRAITKFLIKDLTTAPSTPKQQGTTTLTPLGKTKQPTIIEAIQNMKPPSNNANGNTNTSTNTSTDTSIVLYSSPDKSRPSDSNNILATATTDPPASSITTGSNHTKETHNINTTYASAAKSTLTIEAASSSTPNKQLNFSIGSTDDTRPLSSVKMVPKSKPSNPYKKTASKSTPKTASRGVVFSPNAPEVRILDNEPEEPEETTPPPPVPHLYRTVFELSIRVGKTEDVQGEVGAKLIQTLAFLQKWVDERAAYLPKLKTSEYPHITNKATLPTVIYVLQQHYFGYGNPNWFYAAKGPNGKMVRVSVTIGTDKDPSNISPARADINKYGVGILIKPHQDVDTSSRITLLGAPNGICLKEAKAIVDDILRSTEEEMKRNDPDYDREMFPDEWMEFAIINSQPQGLPYVPSDDKAGYSTQIKDRRSLHIMCSEKDYPRIVKLMYMAKAQDKWVAAFGMCYPTEAPDSDFNDSDSNRYARMVEIHKSVQMCYASTVISGLYNADMEYTLKKDDGTSATITAKKLISHITVFDPESDKFIQVFLCTLRGNDKLRRYQSYFSGGNAAIRDYVEVFRKCPAAQLYYYLLKRRFLPTEVARFIRGVFQIGQLSLISKAKYDKVTGLAYVPLSKGNMDIIDAATAPGSGIDLYAGLSAARTQELKAINYAGPKVGDMDYIGFSDGQSVTTIKNNSGKYKSDRSVDTIGVGKRSVYEPAGSVANSVVDDAELDDIGDDDNSVQVEIDFGSLLLDKPPGNTGVSKVNEPGTKDAARDGNLSDMDVEVLETDPSKTPAAEPTATDLANVEHLQKNILTQSNTSTLHLGAETNTDLPPPAVPAFAVALRSTTNDYKTMLLILDQLILEANAPDDTTLQELKNAHILVTDELREKLKLDLNNMEETLTEYLECLKEGVDDAQCITTLYENDPDEISMSFLDEDGFLTNRNTAQDTDESGVKPQGCVVPGTAITTTEGAGSDGTSVDGAARLGASLE